MRKKSGNTTISFCEGEVSLKKNALEKARARLLQLERNQDTHTYVSLENQIYNAQLYVQSAEKAEEGYRAWRATESADQTRRNKQECLDNIEKWSEHLEALTKNDSTIASKATTYRDAQAACNKAGSELEQAKAALKEAQAAKLIADCAAQEAAGPSPLAKQSITSQSTRTTQQKAKKEQEFQFSLADLNIHDLEIQHFVSQKKEQYVTTVLNDLQLCLERSVSGSAPVKSVIATINKYFHAIQGASDITDKEKDHLLMSFRQGSAKMLINFIETEYSHAPEKRIALYGFMAQQPAFKDHRHFSGAFRHWLYGKTTSTVEMIQGKKAAAQKQLATPSKAMTFEMI